LQVAEAATTNADAGLLAADREVDSSRAKVASARARLTEVQARATRAAQDLARLQPLADKDEIPRQQLDAATSDKHAADAAVASAEAAIAEAQANLSVSEARRAQASGGVAQAQSQARAAATAPQQIALIEARASGADAQVQLARAALDQARLNLERATVRAPADGLVSRRTVELGQVVQPGQPLMAVTSLGDVWVTANFKETQLTHMAAGQRAEGRSGRVRTHLRRARRVDFAGDRRHVQPAPAGQRHRQLREGRAARTREDRARTTRRMPRRC
jgi:membrane fusion protein (multidrug efflux system)